MRNIDRKGLDAGVYRHGNKYCSNAGKYRSYNLQYLRDIKEIVTDIKKDR